jgi:hypothetical protein
LRRSRPNRRQCLTLWQKRTSRKRSKIRGDSGTGVYMRDGTTSRVMAADRPYGEFYPLGPWWPVIGRSLPFIIKPAQNFTKISPAAGKFLEQGTDGGPTNWHFSR